MDRLSEAGQKMNAELEKIVAEKGAKTLKDLFPNAAGRAVPKDFKMRKNLKGHLAKIYAMHWGTDHRVLSASQDGKLLVWDAATSNKLHAIPLRSSWVMTCAFSPSGRKVAAGGLDNMCSVYDLESQQLPIRPTAELVEHTGYLSCCRFVDESTLLTSSGDGLCLLWDSPTRQVKARFDEHVEDVMSVSINDDDNNVFVSASTDATCKLWDARDPKQAKCTFRGHELDVNAVEFLRNKPAFISGSDDTSCRLFDIRSVGSEVAKFSSAGDVTVGVTSVDASTSGRFLFTAHEDAQVLMWDTLSQTVIAKLNQHLTRVSALGMSREGDALCTASWDATMRIWA